MIYCQDCGAANDITVTFCRICGRGLSPERGSLLCPACSQPIVNQASFCSSCGITVMQAPAAKPALDFAFAGAAAEGGVQPPSAPPLNPAVQVINESLDLPDWLKRAAAELPHDSAQTTDNSFMYTGINPSPAQPLAPIPPVQPQIQPVLQSPNNVQTTPPQAPASSPESAFPTAPPSPQGTSLWPAQVQPTMKTPVAPAPGQPAPGLLPAAPGQARKLVSSELPIGGLDQVMPSWLNQSPQVPAQPAPVGAQSVPPAPAPAQTDTTSFISESDLPAWIRQLAEAEELKKAQEAADAATAAATTFYQPAPPEAPPSSQDLFGEGSLAHRISQLPGEAEPPAVASNPWLNRRDQLGDAEVPQADLWSRPKTETDRRVEEETYAKPAQVSAENVQAQTPLISESEWTEEAEDNTLRLALLIAAAVSVAALAAYLFMTGSL